MEDVWEEIIVRIDPSHIFSCITVCKGWLELITASEFRQAYKKRWRNNSKVVGLTSRSCTKPDFFATSKLGRIMEASEHGSKFFISKSGEGRVLFGSHPKTLYVSGFHRNNFLRLSNVPRDCDFAAVAILPHERCYFKVILITYHGGSSKNIHTYFSATHEWRSRLVHEGEDKRRPWKCGREAGIVSHSRGVVYWPQRGGKGCWVYDDNNERKPLSWIAGPVTEPGDDGFENYGLSPQGHLLKATSFRTGRDLWNRTEIWRLHDDDKVWSLLYTVLPPNHGNMMRLTFLSLSPGTLDSFIVQSAKHIFRYHPYTQELVRLSEEKWTNSRRKLCTTPLTMADLGVWPSSSFSNPTTMDTGIIKEMLGNTGTIHRIRIIRRTPMSTGL